jgi:hypothetical protein
VKDTICRVNVSLTSPVIENIVHLDSEPTWFFGVVDEKPIVLHGDTIKLGEINLFSQQNTGKRSIISTDNKVFVSQSKKNLMVFDGNGVELSRVHLEYSIRFGSIGEDANTVYGLDGLDVLRISEVNRNIKIEKVANLTCDRP